MCGTFSGLLVLFLGSLSVFLIPVICSVRCCCVGFFSNMTLVMLLVLLFMVSTVDPFHYVVDGTWSGFLIAFGFDRDNTRYVLDRLSPAIQRISCKDKRW